MKEALGVPKPRSSLEKNNIRPGMPMALLEDALVPLYFITVITGGSYKIVGGITVMHCVTTDKS